MALLFMDGFDAGDFAMKWNGNTGWASISSDTPYGTGKSLYSGGGENQWATKLFSPQPSVFVGAAVKSNYASVSWFRLCGDNDATIHLTLRGLSNNTIELRRGTEAGALLATASVGPIVGVWNYIEMSATIDDVSGVVKVRMNGIEVISYTGDTKNGGANSTIDSLRIPGLSYFDNLYLCNNSGTQNNTFLGDVRVQTLVPTAAGQSTQFTPTGGANYANVADIPDSEATYNASSTQGQRDLYGLSDLAAGTGTVLGVQTNMLAKKTDAGLAPLKEAIYSGGTVYYGDTTQLPSSTAWSGKLREVDPATGVAWTVNGVNNLEGGFEVA